MGYAYADRERPNIKIGKTEDLADIWKNMNAEDNAARRAGQSTGSATRSPHPDASAAGGSSEFGETKKVVWYDGKVSTGASDRQC